MHMHAGTELWAGVVPSSALATPFLFNSVLDLTSEVPLERQGQKQ